MSETRYRVVWPVVAVAVGLSVGVGWWLLMGHHLLADGDAVGSEASTPQATTGSFPIPDAETLPPVETSVLEETLPVMEASEEDLQPIRIASDLLASDPENGCEEATAIALSGLTPDQLLELSAAVGDQVLADVILAWRVELLEAFSSCQADGAVPTEVAGRLATLQELLDRRMSQLESAS